MKLVAIDGRCPHCGTDSRDLSAIGLIKNMTIADKDTAIQSLREQLATVTAERDEYRIKHEVACSMLELVKERRGAAQRALTAQCKHTKDLEAERDELLALVIRYRKETPLGHQPHMIAHLADAAIAKVRKP